MKKIGWKSIVAAITIVGIMGGLVISSFPTGNGAMEKVEAAKVNKVQESVTTKVPKYIFVFIGDGMSYPQIQAASDYLGVLEQPENSKILKGNKPLNFMEFPGVGSAVTYDSTSFCPDSASTATSIATGHKTYSGSISVDESGTVVYETIAEKLKKQKGYKIGVLTTVNLNHATPAAFYAHQASRNNYYEIGQQLVKSNFDYFAGGALLQPTGKEKDKKDIYELAKKQGFEVIKTQKEAKKVTARDGKVMIIGETLADAESLSYAKDSQEDEWKLKDYVKKGIEVLDNKKGFFMVTEAGKIDWACHANDAGSSIEDTLAFSEAIQEAITFYKKHPKETLIVVTGDHETGGLTIGYAGTNYDIYLRNLENQKISYAKFDSDYVAAYKKNRTSFEEVLKDIKDNFGLISAAKSQEEKESKLTLTEYELKQLKKAYDKTMSSDCKGRTQEEYILYGSYEPLTVTVTHLLNHKSGISFSSYSHTALPVGVFAKGQGEELFKGYYDNTDIYKKLASIVKVK